MSSAILLTASYLLTSSFATSQISFPASSDVQSAKKVQALTAIASRTVNANPPVVQLQKYGGDTKGPDPHGCDPHDEQHDSNLPANKDRDFNKAPDDVYGGKYPNGRAPY